MPTIWSHPRLGLVIGKESVKLSVERNRLKRLIRDSFRLHQELLAGLDIVVVARKGLGGSGQPGTASAVRQALEALGPDSVPKPHLPG